MDDVLYQEALGETCTVPIDSLTEFDKDYITSKEKLFNEKKKEQWT